MLFPSCVQSSRTKNLYCFSGCVLFGWQLWAFCLFYVHWGRAKKACQVFLIHNSTWFMCECADAYTIILWGCVSEGFIVFFRQGSRLSPKADLFTLHYMVAVCQHQICSTWAIICRIYPTKECQYRFWLYPKPCKYSKTF